MSKMEYATETGASGTAPPEEKFWTRRNADLGTERVSYEDSTSSAFFELEREAVFRRSWLYVGREDELKGPGAYFTKELEVLKTSLIIARGRDRKIRAFHNTCPHRGNKLVWEGHPAREVKGRAMRFVCKYHGLGFGLDGNIEILTSKDLWFDDQGSCLHLAEVALEIVNGFIFVNLDRRGPQQDLKAFLGDYHWEALSAFEFGGLTATFKMVGVTASNWKTLSDAFSEGYHVATLHKWTFPFGSDNPEIDLAPRALGYMLKDPHRSSLQPGLPPDLPMNFAIERLAKANGIGPQYAFPKDRSVLPAIYNPDGKHWSASTHNLFPNMTMQIYYPGWYLTYAFWPLAHDRMRFEIDLHFPQPEKFSDLFSQATALGFLYDAFQQDLSTLDATQRGLEAEAFDSYPLMDEEILIRHFHKMIYAAVDRYAAEQGIARG
ncbi:MAG: aromatic ring-hydroxylating dioxygenase subunit alpha [Beijerinckiaceae bacterium]|nr:aromatic ring-hydroxylating dioxygenase subunit alpha [Beijerinckiaceae bacterium]